MTSEGYRAEYMYSLLDYHTYRVFCDGRELALVTINTVDRSVDTTLLEGVDPWVAKNFDMPYKRLVAWLKRHERPALAGGSLAVPLFVPTSPQGEK